MPTGIYPRSSLDGRFWSKVDVRGPTECWPWLGAHQPAGYGQISSNGRLRPAPQVAWELHHGQPFPEGKEACHECDNPPCCNWAHIFPGTRADNVADCWSKGRASRPPLHHGEKHHKSKLTASQVAAIRLEYRRGVVGHGAPALAKKYGVSTAAIGYIVRGQHWKDLP